MTRSRIAADEPVAASWPDSDTRLSASLSAVFVAAALLSFVWTPYDVETLNVAARSGSSNRARMGVWRAVSAAVCKRFQSISIPHVIPASDPGRRQS